MYYDGSKITGRRKSELREIVEDIDTLVDGVTDSLDELDDAASEDREDMRELVLDAVGDLLSRVVDLTGWREKLKVEA